MWSIKPQFKTIQKVRIEVPVKFCHTLLLGDDDFLSLKAQNGWVAVHLAYSCQNGEIEVYNVHRSMKSGNYSFHVPDTIQEIHERGRVTNAVNPQMKLVKHAPEHGMSRIGIIAKLMEYTKQCELTQHVVGLIDAVYDDVAAGIEGKREKLAVRKAKEATEAANEKLYAEIIAKLTKENQCNS
jgi:hypothetical protein